MAYLRFLLFNFLLAERTRPKKPSVDHLRAKCTAVTAITYTCLHTVIYYIYTYICMIFDVTGSTLIYNHEDVHKLPICTFLFALHICIPTGNDSSAHGLRAVKHRARCLHRECDKLRTGERRHQ